MKLFHILFIALFLGTLNTYSMQTIHTNGDTLVLKGKIIKEPMENKRGQKLEGVQDLYFSTSSGSYFIKLAGGRFLRKDLEGYLEKEITIKAVKMHGNLDIAEDDPSYAQTRTGEYIVILEITE